ncbi:MAG: hypothetical protein KAY37_02400 [Phycisphaerae bacterium]|nr:hypothetical protein [Phycisphaerae bacterium]
MSYKLPAPATITDDEIRKTFERHGYSFESGKIISIDILDVLVPLLTIVQWSQWWGKLCELNNLKTDYAMDTGFQGITTHAANQGQKIGVVPVTTLHDALKMASVWLANIRAYGRDPSLRTERIDDEGVTQVSNEWLDSIAPILMAVLALTLPPVGLSDNECQPG